MWVSYKGATHTDRSMMASLPRGRLVHDVPNKQLRQAKSEYKRIRTGITAVVPSAHLEVALMRSA
jgi:hypothetical protein